MSTFTTVVDHNPYLPDGGSDVHAIVSITAADTGSAGAATGAQAAELIIIDTSGSMANPGSKIRAARAAAAVALDEIIDGTLFGVISGSGHAREVYPGTGAGLVAMSEETRREAKARVRHLEADGGTAIGSWLRLATSIFDRSTATQEHAILLTDGKNESESARDFRDAVEAARGVFQCDCRGIGDGWVVDELRYVANALLGSVDLIADPEQLADDFQTMMREAMGRGIPEATLRVWAPQGAQVLFVKQVAPSIVDLADRRMAVDERTGDYPTGAWGDENREFHVAVRLPSKVVGTEQLAARVQLLVGGQLVTQGLVNAVWSGDEGLTTRIDPSVAHYTGQAELASAIQEGLAARSAGDNDLATSRLGRAVQLAEQTGNDDATSRLRKIVDVVDGDTGTVRLRKDVAAIDEMALDTRSTRTTRTKK
jgi:von Willebrand factor type A C-terminal domain/von Willebrand factor type A domain